MSIKILESGRKGTSIRSVAITGSIFLLETTLPVTNGRLTGGGVTFLCRPFALYVPGYDAGATSNLTCRVVF